MSTVFGSIWWLIVSLGILVTFHEFGHYLVARLCGVKVLRFSVGFGRPLWKRVGRDGTEYVVAMLPLGGYVKMLDEREVEVAPHELPQAFTRKTVWQRFAIVAAGPAFNLVLCLALLWGMFVIGKNDYQPLVGRTQSLAAQAGLALDDRIVAIDGERMDTWTHAAMAITAGALDRAPLDVEVLRANGDTRTLTLDLSRLDRKIDETTALRDIGIVPRQFLMAPLVGPDIAGTPAQAAGLQPGDRIVAVGAQPIQWWDEVGNAVQAQAAEGRPLRIDYTRDGQPGSVDIVPTLDRSESTPRWVLGIPNPKLQAQYDALLRFGPIDAIGASLHETWRLTGSTFGMLWRMVNGSASLKNISGPISIAQYANDSAQRGVAWFLWFLAILSLSLCIMNLLPIPILDGGHLLYYLIEMVKGSPVSERTLIAGQYLGIALLAGLMGLAFYNDIARLVSS
ncbi:RIP metalloprotease RseP [Chiayiivirga flava]|uniref:Zinc metalloprotease n=1 Tax=Chiayiivirga flava TaxID=659595 RepID=A0A7W8D580_9GAMM|nr:RIP metalloprotease RseP [Chiayiivirga flava]MBB5206926.1 regulator of sigma E protease [Chiayiivirga flava]